MICTTDPNGLLAEADRISAALSATAAYMKVLAQREEDIFAELEIVTRPETLSSNIPRVTIRRGYTYQGNSYRCPTYLSIYMSILRQLWTAFPEKRETIAKTVARSAYSRRYIAENRMSLFSGMSEEWTVSHSTHLCDGWYVDTNVNKRQIRQILCRAVAAAGLKWGEDVLVTWDTRFGGVSVN